MPIQPIPLSKLIPSRHGTRRTGALLSIDELAASIAAHGLLQNLSVRPADDGKFAVVIGRRRLLALKRLVRGKTLSRSVEIPCYVLNDEDDTEISLAENTIRLPLHPADQYDAFKAIADQGKGPEEIAARFGCSPLIVKQRLRLAAIAPALLTLYRKDEIDLDQLIAFAVSDDHAAQQKLWHELPAWNRHPTTIRRLLMQAHVDAADHRAIFVGLDAYVAAGGAIVRDLFQPEHQGYLTDPALLERLALEKLQRTAEALRSEGWHWVEIMPDIDDPQLHRPRRVYPERVALGDEQQAEIDRLTQSYDDLVTAHGDEPSDPIAAELAALSERIDALTQQTLRWKPEDIARAGAVVGIGHGGSLAIERGLVRAEDEVAGQAAGIRETAASRAERGKPHEEGALPDRLTENLTAHRTAALQAELGDNADMALTAVAHALILPVFYTQAGRSCLAIRVETIDLRSDGVEESLAALAVARRQTEWRERLPADADALWCWLQQQTAATRLALLAHCVGMAVNAVHKPHEQATGERLSHADQLAVGLGLDMTRWWQVTGETYLRHVTKAQILDTVAEAVSPAAADNLSKLKKDALVAAVEQRLAGTGWLPLLLRLPTPAETEPASAAIAAE